MVVLNDLDEPGAMKTGSRWQGQSQAGLKALKIRHYFITDKIFFKRFFDTLMACQNC